MKSYCFFVTIIGFFYPIQVTDQNNFPFKRVEDKSLNKEAIPDPVDSGTSSPVQKSEQAFVALCKKPWGELPGKSWPLQDSNHRIYSPKRPLLISQGGKGFKPVSS